MSSDELIGPALPPMFRNRENDEDSDSDEGFSGPALPPGYKRGEPSSSSEDSEEEVTFKRAKTSHTAAQSSSEKVEDTKVKEPDEDGFFGPALPPGFMKQQSSPERPPVLGPALPPGFRRAAYEDDDDDNKEEEDFPGPALPPGYQADSSCSEGEDDVIGPMPHKGPVEDSTALDFERRARKMKDKLTGDDTSEVVARETWMTVLPPELQHIGLGARTFKKKSGPENKDRSMWTDTPEDRERKIRERIERKNKGEEEKVVTPQICFKDIKMAEKVTKYNETKRAESLVSMHTKTMKEKAKKKVDVPVERRAFDRDEDLQVNRFDEAQKERLLKKSQELNTRFSHSRDRMFL
ncbi:GPALPP motifs-containing protein 1 [Notothenia coriiceps]|uniref:GPALPP motifs-containing protein 1 n=1 Tax=Notothenia coriiceps TaxID=8208 RepID=A0A6I9NYT8_9TELE|nr:PREDICTED: GPALPP motifs-containing protein 1 [Notothenia coriiceps]